MNLLELNRVKELIAQGYAVVDTRKSEIFCEGFIEDSISIPFNENFIDTLNELTETGQLVLIVADESEVPAISKALKDSGTQNIEGFLQGGFDTWKNAGSKVDMLIAIDADEFAIDYKHDEFYLVDVRSKEDFAKEHAEDAENIELSDLDQIILEFETGDSYYVYATNSNEAITAGSIFKRAGFNRIRVVAADYETIKAAGIPLFVQKKKENSSSK